MNRLRILIVFIFGLISLHTSGKEIKLGLGSGYQWYNMKYLKDFTNDIPRNMPFLTKTLSNYPPYWNFGGFLGFANTLHYEIGLRYNFASTGSKISRLDYSGEYKFLSIINRNSTGIYFTIPFYKPARFMTQLVLDAGYLWTNLKITESLMLNDLLDETTVVDFKSDGFYMAPSLQISYNILPIYIMCRVGYEVNISNREFIGDNVNLPPDDSDDPKPNWSGAFINISVAYKLNTLFK